VSVVRLIVATRSSGLPASDKIIKEMPGSVASGTPYTLQRAIYKRLWLTVRSFTCLFTCLFTQHNGISHPNLIK